MATSKLAERGAGARGLLRALFLGVSLLLGPVTATAVAAPLPVQCAMCRESVAAQSADGDAQRLGAALNRSILFLLSVPGLLALVLWVRVRRVENDAG